MVVGWNPAAEMLCEVCLVLVEACMKTFLMILREKFRGKNRRECLSGRRFELNIPVLYFARNRRREELNRMLINLCNKGIFIRARTHGV